MRHRIWVLAVMALCGFSWSAIQAQEQTVRTQAARRAHTQKDSVRTVTNGKYKIVISSVKKTHVMMGNMVPRTPNSDFLVVNLETKDPCFDADSDVECFGSKLAPLTRVAAACGKVKVLDKTYDADGGGLIDGKLTCGYVIPQESSGSVTIQFTGYPDFKSEIK